MSEPTQDNTAPPVIKTFPRSFGFNFKDEFFQGTVINVNGQNDIYSFYKDKEFTSLDLLFTELNLNDADKSEFIAKLNAFVK